MIESLYSFGQMIITYFSNVVNILSSVEILGFSALELIFGLGIGTYFAYVAIQWFIPE